MSSLFLACVSSRTSSRQCPFRTSCFSRSPVSSTHTYASQIEKAFHQADFPALANLLRSYEFLDEPLGAAIATHPWAVAPRTVAALAAARISLNLSQKCLTTGPPTPLHIDIEAFQHQAVKSGVVRQLFQNMSSSQVDTKQHAVRALYYLTFNLSVECAECLFNDGAMPILVEQLNSPVSVLGLRVCVSGILRNIFVTDMKMRKCLADMGGVQSLVDLLWDSSSSDEDNCLEPLLDLHDMIEDDIGMAIPEYAIQAIDAGVDQVLMALQEFSSSPEVKEAAKDLCSQLRDVCPELKDRKLIEMILTLNLEPTADGLSNVELTNVGGGVVTSMQVDPNSTTLQGIIQQVKGIPRALIQLVLPDGRLIPKHHYTSSVEVLRLDSDTSILSVL